MTYVKQGKKVFTRQLSFHNGEEERKKTKRQANEKTQMHTFLVLFLSFTCC